MMDNRDNLKEIVSHFTSGGSDLYLLCLNASKAFDGVEYVKLFSGLLRKNMNSVHLRCLIDLYTNQKLCVKFNNNLSPVFSAKNGVKQGGILSRSCLERTWMSCSPSYVCVVLDVIWDLTSVVLFPTRMIFV